MIKYLSNPTSSSRGSMAEELRDDTLAFIGVSSGTAESQFGITVTVFSDGAYAYKSDSIGALFALFERVISWSSIGDRMDRTPNEISQAQLQLAREAASFRGEFMDTLPRIEVP